MVISNLDNLEFNVDDSNLAMIARVVTGSSRIHTELLSLFSAITGLPSELAAAVVGTMDSRALFERAFAIIALRAKMNRKIRASYIRRELANIHKVRNHLAHGDLLGIDKISKNMIFLVHQYYPDENQEYLVRAYQYDVEDLKEVCKSIDRVEAIISKIASNIEALSEIPN